MQAQQIITLACQIAKVPAYTTQAAAFLNAILSDLCQTYDFELAYKSYIFNFDTTHVATPLVAGAGPNPLPADFLRLKGNEAIYNILGVPYVMIKVDQDQYDAAVQTAGFSSYPSNFYIDIRNDGWGNMLWGHGVWGTHKANMYVWPPASGSYPCQIKYYSQMADIPTPETSTIVPWFPNTNYLITRLALELMKITNDDRLADYYKMSDDILDRYLKMKDDPEGKAKTVSLDRRRFGRAFSGLPNTKTVGW